MRLFAKKPPWYASGLAFECHQCGRCCAGPQEGYVWVTRQEVAAIAQHRGLSERQMRDRYVRRVGVRHSLVEKPNHDCVFLVDGPGDRRSCAIYGARPVQCRTWPFWESNVSDPDAWAYAQMRCPGINRGRLYGCDEITARANGIAD